MHPLLNASLRESMTDMNCVFETVSRLACVCVCVCVCVRVCVFRQLYIRIPNKGGVSIPQ